MNQFLGCTNLGLQTEQIIFTMAQFGLCHPIEPTDWLKALNHWTDIKSRVPRPCFWFIKSLLIHTSHKISYYQPHFRPSPRHIQVHWHIPSSETAGHIHGDSWDSTSHGWSLFLHQFGCWSSHGWWMLMDVDGCWWMLMDVDAMFFDVDQVPQVCCLHQTMFRFLPWNRLMVNAAQSIPLPTSSWCIVIAYLIYIKALVGFFHLLRSLLMSAGWIIVSVVSLLSSLYIFVVLLVKPTFWSLNTP